MEERQTVVIAEDHTLLREGLKSLLSAISMLSVIGEASDGQMVVELCEQAQPDLVVMDLSMPRMDGLKATRIIKRRFPHVKVLVLTVHGAGEYVYSALSSGADGYLLKDATNAEFTLAIESVLAGKTYLSPAISGDVVKGYLSGGYILEDEAEWAALTPREQEVFQLVAEGYKNREIADMLVVSIKTVEKHRSNLMQKLGVHSATELRMYARDKGVLLKQHDE